MHVLPQVRELERRHRAELVVVGVHSGKFIAERKTDRIRKACARLDVEHPVVNDRYFRQWRSYAVQAWPTVAVVDPGGYVATVQSGEFDLERMDGFLRGLIARHSKDGSLVPGELDFGADPRSLPAPSGILKFPGRVVERDGTLFVADSGNHRVVEVELQDADGPAGRVRRLFGDGSDGFSDGPAGGARFAEPQGLALADDALFVADRRNHAIRRIDLETGEVTTVAGTGHRGSGAVRTGSAESVDLRSPWGLVLAGEGLFVAMAGTHQIFRLGLDNGRLDLYCGSGVEAIGDGLAERATLAQPTGLTSDGETLFFADSESSAVRAATLANGWVRTLVGTGLFDFGDRDGVGDEARLEHVQDVALHGGVVLVADTYSNKIKRIDPSKRACTTLPGDAGSGDVLDEPSGIYSDGERVFVADTNNHRIAVVDAETGAVSSLVVTD